MPSFGKFETTREISSSHGAEVYLARLADETPPKDYVVKVFSIELLVGDDAQTKSDLDPILLELSRTFSDRIQIQKDAAQASPHVAPVIDSGRSYRGPWFVTPLYPRTLQKVISGKVALSQEGFLHIMRSVTAGALALKKARGRSHGNLKLPNVLIGGAEKLSNAQVAVSDPLPGDEAESARYELADLKAIGRILYQLVRRREMSDTDEWMILPIQNSKEWTDTFGRNASRWLELCNRLLDNGLSLQSYSLERLAADLQALQPKPLLPLPLVLAVIAVAVVAGGAFAGWKYLRKVEVPTATLNFSSDPVGAEIFIGAKDYGKTPVQIKLATNAVPYDVVASWMQQKLTNSIPVEKAAQINVPSFVFKYGIVEISSIPPGASVKMDGTSIGITGDKPLVWDQPLGAEVTYQFNNLTLTDFKPATTNVTIATDHEKISVVITMEKNTPGKGTVVFESNFKRGVWNSISTPGGETLTTSESQIELAPGHYIARSTYTNSISHKVWPELTNKFDLAGGSTTTVSNIFDTGYWEIDSVPDNVAVSEGPNLLGETPLNLPWPPGQARLTLSKDGFDSTNITITVKNGQTVNFSPHLSTPLGLVEITTDPPGAEIFDSSRKSLGRTAPVERLQDEPPIQLAFPPGPISLSAHLEGLPDVTTSLTVEKGVTKRVNMAFNYAELLLEVDPPSATVSREGAAPASGQMSYHFYDPPGSELAYRIAAPPDYETVATNIILGGAGQKTKVHIGLPHRLVKVKIETVPPVAAAIADESQAVVKLNNSMAALPWGPHKLTASYPNLDSVTSNVVVQKDQKEPIVFKFTYGTLILTSSPPNAAVLLHGSNLAVTPHTFYLKPAPYLFDLVIEDQTNAVNVQVAAGESKEIGPTFAVNPNARTLFGIDFVRLRDDFWVGKYDVTQQQYQEIMGKNPSAHQGDPRLPVDSVSWDEATEFCHRLTGENRQSKTPFHPEWEFRLPTKMEWENFAAEQFTTPNTTLAVYRKTSPAVVGSLGPNSKGLYDVRGNVWQWLYDQVGTDQANLAGSCYEDTYLVKGDFCINAATRTAPFPTTGFRIILGSSVVK